MSASAGTPAVITMVIASALFWLQYVDLKDTVAPEPLRRLLAAFGLGIVAALMAMGAFTVLDIAGLPALDSGGVGWMALFSFGLIGPIEEGAKILVAALIVFRWQEFDEPIDGFVYAAAISLGFATLENLHHLPGMPVNEQLARAITLPLTHTLFAAVWGLGIARARLGDVPFGGRRLWAVGSVVLAMSLHGLYDFILFAWEATLLTSGIALVLWLVVIARAHTLTRQARWGYYTRHGFSLEPTVYMLWQPERYRLAEARQVA